jgi:hypothetical protein
MSTPNAYKLKVDYEYAREYIPLYVKVAKDEAQKACWCHKCGFPYITSREHKNTELCTYCSGHSPTVDDQKQSKHREYMRGKARERRQA